MIEIAIIVAAVIITLAIIPVIIRMAAGPTILDRTVGADMMFVFVLMGLLLYTASTGTQWAVGGMLAITGLGFIGTLAVARFVAREDFASRSRADSAVPSAGNADERDPAGGSGGSAGGPAESAGGSAGSAGGSGASANSPDGVDAQSEAGAREERNRSGDNGATAHRNSWEADR